MKALDPKFSKILCIGDSITDGNTYPALLRQAFAEAGYAPPAVVNGGIAGETSGQMLARLEDDLKHKPSFVTILAGANDMAQRRLPAEEYGRNIRAIAQRIRKDGVPLLILTPCPMTDPERDAALAGYIEQVRAIAKEYGCSVGENNKLLRDARSAGNNPLEGDGVHITYEGYRVITRGILDAMGFPQIPVPARVKNELLPGLISPWEFKLFTKNDPKLTDELVASLKTDDSWKTFTLPDTKVQEALWLDDDRQRGFAVSLPELLGKGGMYVGVAVVTEKKPRPAFFNTGGAMKRAWLNGKQIYQVRQPWGGWHAGKERIPILLNADANTFVIETDYTFFASITDTNDW